MARSIITAIVASALWFAASAAQAAGLGKLTVLSPLGQPLLAEVEIVALQAGEEDGLSARLASPDAYNAAGIEISPTLLGVRVDIARRNNRPVLRLTTKQPVNEPFLDMLVELQWPTGRLVREYTFLLDPPDYRSRPTIAAVPAPSQPEVAPQEQAAPSPQREAQPQPQPQAQAQPQPEPEAPAPSEQASATPPQPAAEEKPAEEAKPAEDVKPIEQQPIPAAEAVKEEPVKPETTKEEAPTMTATQTAPSTQATTYEVKKGDTLGAIARANLLPGVTLNQMLIAIFRANQDAFMRGNVNLVRTGKILNIPSGDDLAIIDSGEANRLIHEHNEQFAQYRSRLAAAPATVEGGPEREASGPIERKAQPAPAATPADQVRLSKSEVGKPGAPASQAASQDDAAARQRALEEAQSRTAELEKNLADLQKLLELKNQQLAELEKKAAAKPAPAVAQGQGAAVPPIAPKPAAPQAAAPKTQQPVPSPAPQATTSAPSPAAPMAPPKPAAAPEPAETQAQGAMQAQPPQAATTPKPPATTPAAVKPKPRPAPPPPEPSVLDELLDNPLYLGALALVVLLLAGYAALAWRRKKSAHAKFQDSVMGAAAAGGGAAALHEPTAAPAASVSPAPMSQAPAGMEPEEVDPIAEADVYMAYGRDAQAEEILREALQKASGRAAVHAKLLEIYANRKDAKAFEETALKLKNLTNGSGAEWEKAAALGRAIDPHNSIYGDVAPARTEMPAAPGAAPVLDFDLGGGSQGGPAAPDISLDQPVKDPTASNVDFDLGATNTLKLDQQSPDSTLASPAAKPDTGGLDFNLDLGEAEKPSTGEARAAKPDEEPSGLDFNLDLGEAKSDVAGAPAQTGGAPVLDLGDISLDLGTSGEGAAVATAASADPKWQEVATKLDLAKAYEEMGDKDGARELLNEVVKDGDTAQKGQAQQILAKLG